MSTFMHVCGKLQSDLFTRRVSKLGFLLFFISCSHSIKISTVQQTALIQTLQQIQQSDQQYRTKAIAMRAKKDGLRTQEELDLWAKQTAIDSINMVEVDHLISQYGYPGKELVGENLKSVCAMVILHNPGKQQKYLKLLWKESRKNNVDARTVAILEDRVRMFNGQNQVYGTAMKYDTLSIDQQTNEAITKLRIWDISNFKNLDKKREKVGWYSFRIQCEMNGIDWKQFTKYTPQPNKIDEEITFPKK